MVDYMIKHGKWLLLLTGCIVCGCASLPKQETSIWPWEQDEEKGRYARGDYYAIRAGVANFGEAPKAVKPVTPESLETKIPDSHSASDTSAIKTHPILDSKPGLGKIKNKAKNEYDFTVSDNNSAPPSYLPLDSVRSGSEITAFNHGNAPVSVAINLDRNASQYITVDKPLPLYAVVPPNTDRTLAQFSPKKKDEAYNLRYTYTWSIGDYTASHQCPERYQFPFGEKIQAFASVTDKTNSTPYTRYAVIFSMPQGTPVVAARKGTVIQIKTDDKIDILHEDATIGTYSHLVKINEDIFVGKVVSTNDVIGIAGAAENKKEAYMQLTVWRPEPPPISSPKINSQSIGFDSVSFPLEFCSTDSGKAGVLTKSQPVSRSKMTGSNRQAKRK
jgi:hypothetical protein